MKSTALLTLLAMLAAASSTSLLAGDRVHHPHRNLERDCPHDTAMRTKGGFDHAMQAVPHDAPPDTPGYGWRYFSSPAEPRAVVISPEGNYYYGHGKGLHWIAAEQK